MEGRLHAAGFEVGIYRRLRVPDSAVSLPTSFHVLGTARRPDVPPEAAGAAGTTEP